MTWSKQTMQMINELTPHIKEKPFDPGWFALRQRLEEFDALQSELAGFKTSAFKVTTQATLDHLVERATL